VLSKIDPNNEADEGDWKGNIGNEILRDGNID
jgi:hypothetical protein